MGGEFAVIGYELKERLVRAGFEIVETKEGNYCTVYYFDESCELFAAIDKYLKEKESC